MITVSAMSHSELIDISKDSSTFPGPRLFWVSGYDATQLKTLRGFLATVGYEDVPVKYCTTEQLDDPLGSVLDAEPAEEPPEEGKLPNVMVLSGMTSPDVQTMIGRFKECGLKRPIFATTTPTNMGFTVKTLLRHLREEQRAAMGGRKPRRKSAPKRKKKPRRK